MINYTRERQKQHRQNLIKALRSGKYTQTKNVLRDEIGFCCLGVACDISGLGTWELYPNRNDYTFMTNNIPARISLPDNVREYFGFSKRNGDFLKKNFDHESLADLNDNGSSFEEIATIIENEPATLVLKDD